MATSWAKTRTSRRKTDPTIAPNRTESGDNQSRDQQEDDAEASPERTQDQTQEERQAQVSMDDQSDEELADEAEMAEAESPPDLPPPVSDASADYKVFTQEFDEEIRAEDLADVAELERLRAYLDKQLEPLRGAVSRLANRVAAPPAGAAEPQLGIRQGGRRSGRRTRRAWWRTRPRRCRSRSKRTQNSATRWSRFCWTIPARCGAVRFPLPRSAPMFWHTLERSQVKVESGLYHPRTEEAAQSREKWLANGRPAHPERLNDLRHIIYKGADAPWRRVRPNLELMMKRACWRTSMARRWNGRIGV